MPESSEAHRAAWRAFLMAQRAVLQELECELTDAHDLPLTWYEVLGKLGESHDRRLHMAELATSVLLPPEGMARVVARLEDAGLVRKERCHLHAMEWEIVLTSTGRTRLSRAEVTHAAGVEQYFSAHLTDAEARTLHAAFGRMVDAIARPDARAMPA